MIEDFIADLVYNDIQLIFSDDDHHVSKSCQGRSPLWLQTKICRENAALMRGIDVLMNMQPRRTAIGNSVNKNGSNCWYIISFFTLCCQHGGPWGTHIG
jgi:hypothetical protein